MRLHRYFSFLLIAFLFLSITSCKKEDAHYAELSTLERKEGDRKAAQALHEKALALHKKKNYEESEKLWYQAAKADPSWWKTYYNLACVKALTGESDKAIGYINMALGVKYPNSMLKNLKKDSDLESIRNLDSFEKLLKKSMIIGSWSGNRWVCENRIPPGFKEEDMATESFTISFSRNNEFGVSILTGYTAEGSFKIDESVVKWHLKILHPGHPQPSYSINNNGSFKIDYLSSEFLCIKHINSGNPDSEGIVYDGCFCKSEEK